MRDTLAIALLATALLLPSLANAQGWTGKASQPTMKELIPRMSSDEAYSERYSFAVDLDGGGHIGIDFTISNLGFGDGHGAAAVRVKLPKKRKYEWSKKVSESDWSASSSSFGLDIANTKVSAKGNDAFVLRHDGEVKVELEFQNEIPMWQPGAGQINVDGGYYAFDIIAPRANVTGRVKIGDKWIDVRGTRAGYADHVATNVAPFDLARRFIRFRDYNEDLFVMWREIQLTEGNGGKSLAWVVVGYKGKIVFSDAAASLKFGKIQKDSRTGYEVPRVVQLDARDGKDSVRLVMKGSKMKKKDLLAGYGRAAKMVASAVSEPYQYDLKGDYQLQMTIGGASATVGGRGHYTIDFLNP